MKNRSSVRVAWLAVAAAAALLSRSAGAGNSWSRSKPPLFSRCLDVLLETWEDPAGLFYRRNSRISLKQEYVDPVGQGAPTSSPVQVRPHETVEHVILVQRADNEVKAYSQTWRDRKALLADYPDRALSWSELRGKVVLDAGCGEGVFVEELRDHGVEAYGLDLKLAPQLRGRSYFFEADMLASRLPSNSIDIIYSANSVFLYEADNRPLVQRVLAEFARILKSGGAVRIAPIYPRDLVAEIAGKLTPPLLAQPQPANEAGKYGAFLELKKP